MNREERALVDETRALIKEVEAGETDHAAWIAIRDRVRQLCEAHTQTEVGKLLGKGDRFVYELLTWDQASAPTPYGSGSSAGRAARERSNRAAARKVLRDPEARQKMVEGLDDDERDDVMQTIAQTPPKDPNFRKARKRQGEEDFDKAARKATQKAFDNLSARVNFYADVPLSDHEKFHLEMIEKLLAILLRGAAMDDELREMLDETAAK